MIPARYQQCRCFHYEQVNNRPPPTRWKPFSLIVDTVNCVIQNSLPMSGYNFMNLKDKHLCRRKTQHFFPFKANIENLRWIISKHYNDKWRIHQRGSNEECGVDLFATCKHKYLRKNGKVFYRNMSLFSKLYKAKTFCNF